VKRFLTIFALIALSVGAIGATQTPAGARGTATPPPSPPPLGVPTLPPSTLPTPSGSSATVTIPTSKGTATPAPPADNLSDPNRVGLSGVWEVQIQRDSATTYTHFKLDQKQTVLTGQYLDANGKKFPVAGSIDGKDVRLVVSMPDGSTLTFTGSVDGTSDMLGMLQTPKESVAFTASYRPKYRWLDNISPNPGLGP
jgi:hypothetical protein